MSYRKSSKVVRTESILDEYDIYFSHVLSPLTKNNRKDEYTNYSAEMMYQQQYYNDRKDYEDVDAEAENYIQRRLQRFEFGK